MNEAVNTHETGRREEEARRHVLPPPSLTSEAAGPLATLGVKGSDGVGHLQLLLSHSGQTSLRHTPVAQGVGPAWCRDLPANLHTITTHIHHSTHCLKSLSFEGKLIFDTI